MVLQPMTVKLSEKEVNYIRHLVRDDYALNNSEAVRKLIRADMERTDAQNGSSWTEVKYAPVEKTVKSPSSDKTYADKPKHNKTTLIKPHRTDYYQTSPINTIISNERIRNSIIHTDINNELLILDRKNRARIVEGLEPINPKWFPYSEYLKNPEL